MAAEDRDKKKKQAFLLLDQSIIFDTNKKCLIMIFINLFIKAKVMFSMYKEYGIKVPSSD
jgi:hypothetical protein